MAVIVAKRARNRRRRDRSLAWLAVLVVSATPLATEPARGETQAEDILEKVGARKGICVVLGPPKADDPGVVVDLAKASEWVVFFQSPEAVDVSRVRQAAQEAGMLGRRVFADRGGWGQYTWPTIWPAA